jgi:hypothetical protein
MIIESVISLALLGAWNPDPDLDRLRSILGKCVKVVKEKEEEIPFGAYMNHDRTIIIYGTEGGKFRLGECLSKNGIDVNPFERCGSKLKK